MPVASVQLEPPQAHWDATTTAPNKDVSSLVEGPRSLMASTELAHDWETWDFDQRFPSFFESIMVPSCDWAGLGEVQMPPDMSTVITDNEEWPLAGDIFGIDFSSAFDPTMDVPTADNEAPSTTKAPHTSDGPAVSAPADGARQRHSVYQKSPWYALNVVHLVD